MKRVFQLILAMMPVMFCSCGGGGASSADSYPVQEIPAGLNKALERYDRPLSGFYNGLSIVTDALGRQGLINLNGEEVLKCGDYHISFVNGYFYLHKYKNKETLYGLADANGKILFDCKYHAIFTYPEENVIILGKKERLYHSYVFADGKGQNIKEWKGYDSSLEMVPTSEVIPVHLKNFELTFISTKDYSVVTEERYSQIDPFLGDYTCVYKSEGGFYGLVNRSGQLAYKSKKENGKVGLVDMNGKEVIPCKYDRISTYDHGYIKVYSNDLVGVYDLDNRRELLPPAYAELEETFYYRATYKPSVEDLFDSMDNNFNHAFRPYRCFNFNGLVMATKDKSEYIAINRKGETVIDKDWHINEFKVYPAVGVILGKGLGVYNVHASDGSLVAEGIVNYISEITKVYDDGSVKYKSIVPDKSGYGIVFPNGKILQPQFYMMFEPSEGLTAVTVAGDDFVDKFIDYEGNTVVELKDAMRFDSETKFVGGLAPVKINGEWAYVNRKGKNTRGK